MQLAFVTMRSRQRQLMEIIISTISPYTARIEASRLPAAFSGIQQTGIR
jgi:hypothetical protein